jgi:uncharacterized protein
MAKSEVFVDTSGWIAISDEGDKYHHPARSTFEQLIAERRKLVTTNLIVAETYIITRRSSGHNQAMKLLSALRSSPRLHRIWSTAELESQAETILGKYPDQDFSFTGAVSFVVMRERGVREAFTFDRHFATLGFSMLPA